MQGVRLVALMFHRLDVVVLIYYPLYYSLQLLLYHLTRLRIINLNETGKLMDPLSVSPN